MITGAAEVGPADALVTRVKKEQNMFIFVMFHAVSVAEVMVLDSATGQTAWANESVDMVIELAVKMP